MAGAAECGVSIAWRGPLTALGLAFAGLVFFTDQVVKAWVLFRLDLAETGPLRLAPFCDLVLTWNHGISYGLFAAPGAGQAILIALSLAVTVGLWLWLARAAKPLTAAALGLIIGGALGNALDRAVHGAVVDFVLLHAYGWSWYVFNMADVAIVAGVMALLYESWSEPRPARG